MKKFVKSLLFGVEVPVKMKLSDATAIISCKSGDIFRISRRGYVDRFLGSYFSVPGEDLVKGYIRSQRGPLVMADDGVVPAHEISLVEMEISFREETVTERKGGIF